MEITKQNEHYQISDSVDNYVVSGSLEINIIGTYSYNISLTDSTNSITMNYYKSTYDNTVSVNYNAPKELEDVLLNYIKANEETILDKINK